MYNGGVQIGDEILFVDHIDLPTFTAKMSRHGGTVIDVQEFGVVVHLHAPVGRRGVTYTEVWVDALDLENDNVEIVYRGREYAAEDAASG